MSRQSKCFITIINDKVLCCHPEAAEIPFTAHLELIYSSYTTKIHQLLHIQYIANPHFNIIFPELVKI